MLRCSKETRRNRREICIVDE